MHHFAYRDGALFAEDVDLRSIVAAVGTPVYVYSSATLERHYRVFADAVGVPHNKVFFAMKANSNIGVLQTLAALGCGADVVSEGEIRKAMAAGIPAERIVFSGVGKTTTELSHAVDVGVYQINVESEGEMARLDAVACAAGKRQAAVIRINPDVGAGGHAKITTGSAGNKFGVSFAEAERLYAAAARLSGLMIKGLAVHIGSQILTLDALDAAFTRMVELVRRLRGAGLTVERLDLGGGLGIPYEIPHPFAHGPDLIDAYAAMVRRLTDGLDVELGFEPGRLIAGNAGILVTQVIDVNERPGKRFLVVDAAMNDLVRPAMYEAYHEIWPLLEPATGQPDTLYDVVGPVCETGDTFTVDRRLPLVQPGDLLAFMTAGAYGAVMASTYNLRRLVPEVLVRGAEFAVTRPRQSYDELIGLDRSPVWTS
jgi:diaminopimelate decarboxylase